MNKAVEIAQYIINSYCAHGVPINNRRLMAILYYAQATFLVHLGLPCFTDDIFATDDGPYISEVSKKYKPCDSKGYSFSGGTSDICLSVEDINTLEFVILATYQFTTENLINCIKNEKPYKLAYESKGKIISSESIKRYLK